MSTIHLIVLFALGTLLQGVAWVLGGMSSMILVVLSYGLQTPNVTTGQAVAWLLGALVAQGAVYYIGKQITETTA